MKDSNIIGFTIILGNIHQLTFRCMCLLLKHFNNFIIVNIRFNENAPKEKMMEKSDPF